MSEYLGTVREQVEAGTVSGQTLVLLFRAAEEAEHQRDVDELSQILELAQQIAVIASDALRAEAERLIGLCEERLARAQARPAGATPPARAGACPGCGRPLLASAVRCRACGTLLV
jgi:hypothetical protein